MDYRGILMGCTAFALLSSAPAAMAQQPISIASSPPGSMYYATAAAIGEVLSLKSGLHVIVQALSGGGQYLPIVNRGDIQFGIADVYLTRLGVRGEAFFKERPTKNLRAVAILYPLRQAIFVRKDSEIKSIADLKGKRGPVGFANAKTAGSITDAILATAGLSLERDIQGVNVVNIIAQANAFKNGSIDFFGFALGAGKVKEVNAATPVRVLTVPNSPEALNAARKVVPGVFFRYEKPNKSATGLYQPGYLVALNVNLFASTKTPDDVVYKVVKGLHDHAKELGVIIPPLRLMNPNAMAQAIPGVEYHAGAIKFYKEIGQWPPKSN